MVSLRVVCRDHIGRAVESRHLDDRRREAARGRGGLVLVRGEPGIGKSRLVDEFEAGVRPPSILARIECRAFAQTPLGPLDDLLSALSISLPAPGESLERRFVIAAAALAALAERRTVVAIFEDLHWAHRDFLEALMTLVGSAASRRMLFIATYRAEEFADDHPGFALLGRLIRDPATSVIALEPLDLSSTRRLLVASLRDTRLPEESQLAAIGRRSGGNPLFAEELLRDAIDGVATDEAEGVPLSIRGIVAERLARCSASERRLASVAALAGRRFRFDIFDVVGLDAAAGAAAIETLCALQLVDVDPSDVGRFVFRHALVRDAIAATVKPAMRGPLHTAIAAALGARHDSDEYAIEIAHHRFAAGERAAVDFARAGAKARGALDFAGAVLWYERASKAARLSGDLSAAFDAEIRAATAALAGSEYAQGERALADVIADSTAQHHFGTLVRASRLLAGALTNDGRLDAAIAVLTAALRTLGNERAEDANLLRLRLASVSASIPAVAPLRTVLETVDPMLFATGTLEAGEYHVLRARLAARRYDLTTWHEAYASALEVGPSIATRHGAWQRFAFAQQAWEAYAFGNLRIAEETLARVAGAWKTTVGVPNDVDILRALFSLAAGDRVPCERALDDIPRSGPLIMRCYRAIAALGLARLGDDRDVLVSEIDLQLLGDARRSEETTLFALVAAEHAATQMALGRPTTARALAVEALDVIVEPFALVSALLHIARLGSDLAERAEAILARGADESGFAFFKAARELARAERIHPTDPLEAASAAAVAGPIFEAAGWRLLAMRSRELAGDLSGAVTLAREVGDDVARRRLSASGPMSGLTAREREIASLVARGKTNRAIGASLAVAEKTVEKHLTIMYEKFAVRSRAELVARLAEIAAEEPIRGGR